MHPQPGPHQRLPVLRRPVRHRRQPPDLLRPLPAPAVAGRRGGAGPSRGRARASSRRRRPTRSPRRPASSCIDLERWCEDEIDRTGHSLVGLLRVFAGRLRRHAGQFIHYGATTQDIQDTGQSLEMRDVLDEVDRDAARHRRRVWRIWPRSTPSTLALGRTHAQPALPIGFGLKVASWVDELHAPPRAHRAARASGSWWRSCSAARARWPASATADPSCSNGSRPGSA